MSAPAQSGGGLASVLSALASATSFDTVCAHRTTCTATRLTDDGKPFIVCEECYQKSLPEDEARRRNARPIIAEACGLCGEGTCILPTTRQRVPGCRFFADIGFGVCDECHDRNMRLLLEAEARHVPSLTIVPDEVVPGVLTIGPKEAAYNRETLRRLGVARVLVCCSFLQEYHADNDDDPTRCPLLRAPSNQASAGIAGEWDYSKLLGFRRGTGRGTS